MRTLKNILSKRIVNSKNLKDKEALSNLKQRVIQKNKSCNLVEERPKDGLSNMQPQKTNIEENEIEDTIQKNEKIIIEIQKSIECKNAKGEEVVDFSKKISEKRKSMIKSVKQNKTEEYNYSIVQSRLLLPKPLLRIIKLYSILLTINRFNKSKSLVSIFIKCKKNIEDLLHSKVTIKDMQQINFLNGKNFEFKKIRILHLNEIVDSFSFSVFEDDLIDFEKTVFDYFLLERNENVPFKKLFDDDKDEIKKKDDMFKKEDIEENLKKRQGETVNKENVCIKKAILTGKERSLSVLERIKQKEALRKESFIIECKKKEDLKERILNLLKIENKKSLSFKSINDLLNLFNGDESIMKMVDEYPSIFETKEFGNEKYLMYKDK